MRRGTRINAGTLSAGSLNVGSRLAVVLGLVGVVLVTTLVAATPATAFCFGQLRGAGTGTPESITASVSPSQIPADGQSTATVTATVEDETCAGVPGQNVTFNANPAADVTIGPTTDNGNGTYTATITSTTTPDTDGVTITATDSSLPGQSAQTSLILTPLTTGPPASVSVTLNPSTVIAGSQTTATATVEDTNHQGIGGQTVQFYLVGQGGTLTPVGAPCTTSTTAPGTGTCSIPITGSTQAGSEQVTAADTSAPSLANAQPQTLTLTAGPAKTITLTLASSQVTVSTGSTTATAKVVDANGNPVLDDEQNLQFQVSPGGFTVSTVEDMGEGFYTATLSAAAAPLGAYAVTVTDTASGAASTAQPLTVSPPTTGGGQPPSVSLTLNPSQVIADGSSRSTATATVTNSGGSPLSGQEMSFDVNGSPSQVVGCTTAPDGQCSAALPASVIPTTEQITAIDNSATPPATSLAQTLTFVPGAASLTVSVSPSAIYADGGQSSAFATAQARDDAGDGVAGDSVQFYVDGVNSGLSCLTGGDGACNVKLASTSVVGPESITAVDTSANDLGSNQAELYMLPPYQPQPSPPPAPPTSPPPSPPPTVTTTRSSPTPTPTEIRLSLTSTLVPRGTSIKSLLEHGAYEFSYRSPGAGTLAIRWYDGSGRRRRLIASATSTLRHAGRATVKLRLTRVGDAVLKHTTHLTLTAEVSFTAARDGAVRRSARFTLR